MQCTVTLNQHLHLLLGLIEYLLTFTGEPDALFERAESLLKRQIPLLHLIDQCFKLSERLLEIGMFFTAGHQFYLIEKTYKLPKLHSIIKCVNYRDDTFVWG